MHIVSDSYRLHIYEGLYILTKKAKFNLHLQATRTQRKNTQDFQTDTLT